ncbi:hypothetical protein NKR23_g11911 [Pleurostoma richardsiae]|uniref:Glutamyl-tRNA(Gln) amidotransferase subunit B, mitochondrial n=1 Tax=Pleurostoma richardsiae TaxID=41990 RepID=A0AA38VGQ5_9PEZI|nr:hypothetical protein NKR23_g11911 [Pleurostoma richardsiae]
MSRVPARELGRYLLDGHLSRRGCLRLRPSYFQLDCQSLLRRVSGTTPTRQLHRHATGPPASTPTPVPTPAEHVPLRKKLKEQAKALKASGVSKKKKPNAQNQTIPGWELTVGIEIHAQLNTTRKLFSPAQPPPTSPSSPSAASAPNTHVALFDLALPGSQPLFQPATLIPALRAALALKCDIQEVSRWDRKHYFHWDQPSGYQITQYYEPFARDGRIALFARDGIAAEDGETFTVGIQQIQMEQDTAKTLAQPGDEHWLDFNRVGVPLIEIITRPEIHHPATAAALVRKIQLLLHAVDACVSGMETGGLRADVNVSVRRTSDVVTGALGQRTEIKNLSSFRAVEDAIIAERDRQIAVLEAGGAVKGETRGWSLGSTETRRLRGKEGEVDYRYMPDPDLGPVVIGDDLVAHLEAGLGKLPDEELDQLVNDFAFSPKDALSIMLLDNGGRVEYFYNVIDALRRRIEMAPPSLSQQHTAQPATERPVLVESRAYAVLVGNWVLHELGRLTSDRHAAMDISANELGMTADGHCERVPAEDLADILLYLHQRKIASRVAKELLFALFRGDLADPPPGASRVGNTIEQHGLWFQELSTKEYARLAARALEGEEWVLKDFVGYQKYPQGKLMFLVGRMMKLGPGERIDPQIAEAVMRKTVEQKARELHH